MTELGTERSDDEDDEDTIYASSYRPQRQLYDMNKQQTPYDRNCPSLSTQDKNTQQNTKYNKASFKGSCHGCGREGRNAGEWYFLLKVNQGLSYRKSNLKAGKEKAAKYFQQSSSNYRDRRAKITHL